MIKLIRFFLALIIIVPISIVLELITIYLFFLFIIIPPRKLNEFLFDKLEKWNQLWVDALLNSFFFIFNPD